MDRRKHIKVPFTAVFDGSSVHLDLSGDEKNLFSLFFPETKGPDKRFGSKKNGLLTAGRSIKPSVSRWCFFASVAVDGAFSPDFPSKNSENITAAPFSKRKRGGCFFDKSYSSISTLMCSSSNCFSLTVPGAPIMTSWAFLFMGKGMISRMDSSPAKSITIRSTPGAMPAWGGAP